MYTEFLKNMDPKSQCWELKAIYPYQHMTKDLAEEHNIRPEDKYFQLYVDGKLASNEWFIHNIHCTKKTDFDKGRYLILCHKRVAKYSDSIVKTCNLKSPNHFESHECVFDKETRKVIYEVEDAFNDHLYIYGNLLEHRTGRGESDFINLKTGKSVLNLTSCEYWEGSDRLFIKTPRYNFGKAQQILTINYNDCGLEELDKK